MERSPHVPQKSYSFSSSSSTAREKRVNRNLSFGAIRHEDNKDINNNNNNNNEKPEKIDEGEEESDNAENQHVEEELAPTAPPDEEVPPPPQDLATIIQEVDHFLAILLNLSQTKSKQDDDQDGGDNNGDDDDTFPEIPEPIIEKFAELVEIEITKLEVGEEKLEINHPQQQQDGDGDGDGDGDDDSDGDGNNNKDKPPTLLEAIERMSKLTSALSPFSSNPTYFNSMSLTGTVLHRAMSFFEDEFYSMLDEASKPNKDRGNNNRSTKKSPTSPASSDPDHVVELYYPSTETLTKLKAIADSMISTGYGTECYQVFLTTRRNALRSGISDHGFEKIAIDDIQKMAWDSLETEITKWVKTFEHVTTVSLPLERELCTSIFGNHAPTAESVFTHLALHITHMFLNFAEAASMTKRAAEKLFKVLDIYEALRDTVPRFDAILPDLKPEISALQSRLGETAFSIFCELENSIKSDVGKNAVPGGAVHPLTRYIMNYLKYAGEYINTLEQIFKDNTHIDEIQQQQQQQKQQPPLPPPQQQQHRQPPRDANSTGDHSPFEIQLIHVMDLLQSNLESKAKLYKELGLKDIFLMNNGRYIVQKIKGSAEINKLLGNTWCRKRSSELRQYHKNYQRDTWSKVLACFKEEGLQVKGSVLKPVLKERFKSFNAQFEEIHKMQSMWVVSDEQLQSELRVSVSAVVVPAYRSFLGRFSQYFTAGRQTEKYVKFGPEELESLIDELFDGNPSSMVRRRT